MGTELQVRQADEARELVRLGFEEIAGAFDGLHSIHGSIAERAFRRTGAGGAPAHWMHDRITELIYGGLKGSVMAAGRAADVAVARRPRAVSNTPGGAALVAAINGLIGDTLERRRSPLHQPMSLRRHGEPVGVSRDELDAAYPTATPRVAVFLHGLMETEFSWRWGSAHIGDSYGDMLQHELGMTPVYVRYNSGRRISENGRSLADLLEEVVAAWPVPVREVALIGHSMGGLVARSAAYQADLDRKVWPTLTRQVISIGTPHMGAPLEQAVHYASAGLNMLPETQPFSRFLRRRSGGIRDLRQGSLVDEDWRDCDPDALRAKAVAEVPLLKGVTHCFVTATITRSPRHPLGRLVGDYLVLQPSGSGRSRTRRIAFDEEYGHHVGGANHFALLNHPAVYDKLRTWLGSSQSSPRPRLGRG
ncbi:MAG TPA: alpha/beta hydrolase [Thermoleophilaceae bacterium]|nr:alpha/beta hydrolase [Thermoleophilaceae bacterium]